MDTQQETITLSPEQEDAAQKCQEFIDNFSYERAQENKRKGYFVLEGYAGTGKSFAVNEIIRRTGLKPAYMAYTGKAALVLNKYHNLDATTIHSKIYKLRQVSDTVFKELYAKREEAKTEDEALEITKEIKELMEPKFELNEEAFDEDNVKLIVLDECSMVDDEILDDLLSFGLPIIALGDPGQLPPVKGTGSLFKGLPDARLTEIRRQSLDSPIIQWSMWARERRPLPMTHLEDWREDLVAKVPKGMVRGKELHEMFETHDVCICWKNITRQNMNSWRRKMLGFHEQDPVFPVKGETLIITKNDKVAGIFNGQFAEVIEVGELFDVYIELEVLPEEAKNPVKLKVLRACFEQYQNPDAFEGLRPWDYKDRHQVDFGYCLTCHKAQGSQWDNVLILEENVLNWHKPGVQEGRAQWLYTAITRAAKKVTMIAGK